MDQAELEYVNQLRDTITSLQELLAIAPYRERERIISILEARGIHGIRETLERDLTHVAVQS